MATKKQPTPKKEPKKRGAPSAYKPEYNEQAYKLCLLGATDKDIADFFGVVESTVNKWKVDYPKFSESIKEGKMIADMEVAHTMFKSTQDREVVEMKAIKVKEVSYNKQGKRVEKETIQLAPETKFVPGDFRSQSLWLRNRQPDKWRDKQEIDHTTKGQPIVSIKLTDIDGSDI